MYLLFKSVNDKNLGIVKRIGTYMSYTIGFIPDTHTDIIDFRNLNATIVNDDIALAWKFIGCAKGFITVRQETQQNDELQIISSEEPLGTKVKYYLTDEDKLNTVAFQKILLQKILDEVYDKRMLNLNLYVSELEMSSWEQQKKEALNYPGTEAILLIQLAQIKGISIEEMVQRVKDAINNYNTQIAELIVNKKIVESEIKSCNTISEINKVAHLRFEIEMPMYQREEENIEHCAIFNL